MWNSRTSQFGYNSGNYYGRSGAGYGGGDYHYNNAGNNYEGGHNDLGYSGNYNKALIVTKNIK